MSQICECPMLAVFYFGVKCVTRPVNLPGPQVYTPDLCLSRYCIVGCKKGHREQDNKRAHFNQIIENLPNANKRFRHRRIKSCLTTFNVMANSYIVVSGSITRIEALKLYSRCC